MGAETSLASLRVVYPVGLIGRSGHQPLCDMALDSIIVSLADDLTGANVTAALLCEAGLTSVHVLGCEQLWPAPPTAQAIVVNIASRDSDEATAGQRLRDVVRHLKRTLAGRPILWNKRIDSTLRGYVSLELQALLSEVPCCLILMAPAFPSAGRVTIAGRQVVESHLVAQDNAVQTDIAAYLHPLDLDAIIPLPSAAIGGGIATALATARVNRKAALIADAVTDGDLRRLAENTLAAWLEGALIVDSGPYLAQLARLALDHGVWPESTRTSPVVLLIGSRTSLTQEQVHALRGSSLRIVTVTPGLDDQAIAAAKTADAIVLSAPDQAGPIDAALDVLVAAAQHLLSCLPRPYTLFLSGGRTAARFFASYDDLESLTMLGELSPLVACGVAKGGVLDGAILATKGGLVGAPDTLLSIIKRLQLLRRFHEHETDSRPDHR
jgi:uncharacterized protein YgbK (DUF1537 family)